MTATNYQYNVGKMYTHLRGYFEGAGLTQSLTALQFARAKHKEQTRKNGVPYIVHPLSMACFISALEIKDDNLF
jgi:(p)ppGpp synthase/HD superfamily hydrolase